MEEINLSMIREKAEELATSLGVTLKTKNYNHFILEKSDTDWLDITCNDDCVIFFINVSTNQQHYEVVHNIVFNECIPELIGCHKETVKNKIVYRYMDEVEETTIKNHIVHYNYGYNFITFKVFKKDFIPLELAI